jgi:hypothetical protein
VGAAGARDDAGVWPILTLVAPLTIAGLVLDYVVHH